MTFSNKTTEFADLFDKLASRGSHNATLNDTDSLDIPKDLEGIFHNLVHIVGSVRSRSRKSKVVYANGAPSDRDSKHDEESMHRIPKIEENYDFTFKFGLHKVHGSDWPRKVKEFLKQSQKAFKSLAEREDEGEEAKCEKAKRHEGKPGDIQFGAEFGIAPRAHNVGRPRSHTVTVAGGTGKGKTGLYSDIRAPQMIREEDRDDVRAVKKRCIGRRKSMSGLNAGEKASWFYEAAVASTERNERPSVFCTTPTTLVRPTTNYGALQGARTRKVVPRRRVSSVAAAGAGSTLSVDTRNMRRRRAVSVAARGNARNTTRIA